MPKIERYRFLKMEPVEQITYLFTQLGNLVSNEKELLKEMKIMQINIKALDNGKFIGPPINMLDKVDAARLEFKMIKTYEEYVKEIIKKFGEMAKKIELTQKSLGMTAGGKHSLYETVLDHKIDLEKKIDARENQLNNFIDEIDEWRKWIQGKVNTLEGLAQDSLGPKTIKTIKTEIRAEYQERIKIEIKARYEKMIRDIRRYRKMWDDFEQGDIKKTITLWEIFEKEYQDKLDKL